MNQLMELSIKLIPADAEEETKAAELAMLDEKLLVSPALAMAEAAGAIGRMGALASENIDVSLKQLHGYDVGVTAAINAREERIDRFADRADNFLIKLSHSLQSEGDDARMNLLMQAVPDFERIGDYATNIDELAERLCAQKVTLSDYAKGELTVIGEAVSEIVKLTVNAFTSDDNAQARRVEPLEEVIDDMVLQLRDNHTERLRRGICTVNGGLVFLETLTYLERAADQCSSIALLMLARENESIKKTTTPISRASTPTAAPNTKPPLPSGGSNISTASARPRNKRRKKKRRPFGRRFFVGIQEKWKSPGEASQPKNLLCMAWTAWSA